MFQLVYSKDGRAFNVALRAGSPAEAAQDVQRLLEDGASSVEVSLVVEPSPVWPAPTADSSHYIGPGS